MTAVLVTYAVTLVVFGLIDMVWLSTVGGQLYKATLGDILAPEIRIGPAVAFYLLFPAGLIYFAVNPAMKDGLLSTAVVNGALFGLFTYATYELTNFATLRNWTLGITVIDIVYGAIVCAVVAAVTYSAAPAISRWFGA